MSDYDEAPPNEARPRGLFDSVSALLASSLAIAHTRLELLGAEIEEQAARLTSLVVWGVIALALTLTAVLLCVVALTVAFWETHRVLIATGFAIAFALLAAIAIYRFLHRAQERPRLFQSTLDELAKDRERLARR